MYLSVCTNRYSCIQGSSMVVRASHLLQAVVSRALGYGMCSEEAYWPEGQRTRWDGNCHHPLDSTHTHRYTRQWWQYPPTQAARWHCAAAASVTVISPISYALAKILNTYAGWSLLVTNQNVYDRYLYVTYRVYCEDTRTTKLEKYHFPKHNSIDQWYKILIVSLRLFVWFHTVGSKINLIFKKS